MKSMTDKMLNRVPTGHKGQSRMTRKLFEAIEGINSITNTQMSHVPKLEALEKCKLNYTVGFPVTLNFDGKTGRSNSLENDIKSFRENYASEFGRGGVRPNEATFIRDFETIAKYLEILNANPKADRMKATFFRFFDEDGNKLFIVKYYLFTLDSGLAWRGRYGPKMYLFDENSVDFATDENARILVISESAVKAERMASDLKNLGALNVNDLRLVEQKQDKKTEQINQHAKDLENEVNKLKAIIFDSTCELTNRDKGAELLISNVSYLEDLVKGLRDQVIIGESQLLELKDRVKSLAKELLTREVVSIGYTDEIASLEQKLRIANEKYDLKRADDKFSLALNSLRLAKKSQDKGETEALVNSALDSLLEAFNYSAVKALLSKDIESSGLVAEVQRKIKNALEFFSSNEDASEGYLQGAIVNVQNIQKMLNSRITELGKQSTTQQAKVEAPKKKKQPVKAEEKKEEKTEEKKEEGKETHVKEKKGTVEIEVD